VQQRSSFTHAHLLAAVFLRDQARSLERGDDPMLELPRDRHRAVVISGVSSSFAFIEANINQLYADAKDGLPGSPGQSLGTEKAAVLAEVWSIKKIKFGKHTKLASDHPTLVKYQAALRVLGLPEFDEHTSPFTEVNLIRETRNALVHAQTETVVAYSSDPTVNESRTWWQSSLESISGSGGFTYSPFTDSESAFFPSRLLSASFADWCLRRCVAFADGFYDRLGPTPPYDGVRRWIDK
jgi:hypothetical protein